MIDRPATLVCGDPDGRITPALVAGLTSAGHDVEAIGYPTERFDAPACDLAVFVADRAPDPRPVVEWSTDDWVAGCEEVMTGGFCFLGSVHASLAASRGRAVVVLPTVAMSGAAGATGLATAAEGLRILAKGAAKQWGAQGVTVNVVAVSPSLLWEGEAARVMQAGQTLNQPAMGHSGSVDDLTTIIGWLTSPHAAFVTATDVLADGGVWTV